MTMQGHTRPTAETWEIPRRVWYVLMSWGLAVLVLAALLSFWIWSNERKQNERDAAALKAQQQAAAQLQLEQDRAMCAMIDVFLAGPEPVTGPAGDRSRSVRSGMLAYQSTLHCDAIKTTR